MGAPSAGGGVDASSSGIAGLGDIFGLSQTPAYVPAQEVSSTSGSLTVTVTRAPAHVPWRAMYYMYMYIHVHLAVISGIACM